jgi:uncharacterized protein
VTAIAEHSAETHLDDVAPRNTARSKSSQDRSCAVSRKQHDPAELIRFVAGPDGRIVPDIKRKLPGRGVWVTASAGIVELAVKKNVFARSLKQAVLAPVDLPDQVDRLLEVDARQSLAMVNKAGMLVTGAFQVEKLTKSGVLGGLIHASDGSADGARKINQALFRYLGEDAAQVERVEIFDSEQLGLALGQTNVIHAALRQGAATDAFLARARRLANYRAKQPKLQTAKARCAMDTQGAKVEDK